MIKIGDKFGKLIIFEELEQRSKDGRKLYKCKCNCGNITIIRSKELLNGDTQSCGCYRIEQLKKKRYIEGTQPDRFNGNINKNNTSGIRGVCFDKKRNKFKAYIVYKRKQYNLGRYNTIAEAEKARELAEKELLNKE